LTFYIIYKGDNVEIVGKTKLIGD